MFGVIGHKHGDGVGFLEAGKVIEVRVLAILVLDVGVANGSGSGRKDRNPAAYAAD
jgi:hypothetical protein